MARPRLEIGEIGEISVTTHNGKHTARCRVRCQDGTVRPVKAVRTSKEAARKAVRTAAEKKAGTGGGTITLESPMPTLIDSWWKTEEMRAASGKIAHDTLTTYRRTVDMIIEDTRHLKVREATATRLGMIIQKRGGKFYTVHRDLKRLLASIFDHAMAIDVMHHNPARAVQIITPPRTQVEAYTPDEVQTLRKIVADYQNGQAVDEQGRPTGGRKRDTYLVDFVDLMLATGCRISEILGLRWQDVDLVAKTITIVGIVKTRKANPEKGEGYLHWQAKGKTPAAWRIIPLGKAATGILTRLHVNNDAGHEYVFSTEVGTLRAPANVRTALRRARDEAASTLPASKTHMLRKTVATLVEGRDGLRAASMTLGHRHLSTTEKHYVSRPAAAPDVSAGLDELLLSPVDSGE